MEKNKKTQRSLKTSSRRKFITKAAAATGAVAAGGLLAGCEPQQKKAAVAKQETVTLKMQAAWPSGANIFFEMAGDYCKMVEQMSGGTLKIDLQPVGAIVKTSEIGEAVSSGVVEIS
jgi:TRAP-type mannitol/chloroaromatic compound transport system substrate-binding protein